MNGRDPVAGPEAENSNTDNRVTQGSDTWLDRPTNDLHPGLTGPCVQLRLALCATNSGASPRVTRVDVHTS